MAAEMMVLRFYVLLAELPFSLAVQQSNQVGKFVCTGYCTCSVNKFHDTINTGSNKSEQSGSLSWFHLVHWWLLAVSAEYSLNNKTDKNGFDRVGGRIIVGGKSWR